MASLPGLAVTAEGVSALAGGVNGLAAAAKASVMPLTEMSGGIAGVDTSVRSADSAIKGYHRDLRDLSRELGYTTEQQTKLDNLMSSTARNTLLNKQAVLDLTGVLRNNIQAQRLSSEEQRKLIRDLTSEFKERGAEMLGQLKQWGNEYPQLWEGIFKGMDPKAYEYFINDALQRGDVEFVRNISRLQKHLQGFNQEQETELTKLADSVGKMKAKYSDLGREIGERLAPSLQQLTASAEPSLQLLKNVAGVDYASGGAMGRTGAQLATFAALRMAGGHFGVGQEGFVPGMSRVGQMDVAVRSGMSKRALALNDNANALYQETSNLARNPLASPRLIAERDRLANAMMRESTRLQNQAISGRLPLGTRLGMYSQAAAPYAMGGAMAISGAMTEYSGAYQRGRSGLGLTAGSVAGGVLSGAISGGMAGSFIPGGTLPGAAIGAVSGGFISYFGQKAGALAASIDRLADIEEGKLQAELSAARLNTMGTLSGNQREDYLRRVEYDKSAKDWMQGQMEFVSQARAVGSTFGEKEYRWAESKLAPAPPGGRPIEDLLAAKESTLNTMVSLSKDGISAEESKRFREAEYKWLALTVEEVRGDTPGISEDEVRAEAVRRLNKELDGTVAQFKGTANEIEKNRVALGALSDGFGNAIDQYAKLQTEQRNWQHTLEYSLNPIRRIVEYLRGGYISNAGLTNVQNTSVEATRLAVFGDMKAPEGSVDRVQAEFAQQGQRLLERAQRGEKLSAIELQILSKYMDQLDQLRQTVQGVRDWNYQQWQSYYSSRGSQWQSEGQSLAAKGAPISQQVGAMFGGLPVMRSQASAAWGQYNYYNSLSVRARTEGWSESQMADKGVKTPAELERMKAEAMQFQAQYDTAIKDSSQRSIQMYIEGFSAQRGLSQAQYQASLLTNSSMKDRLEYQASSISAGRTEVGLLEQLANDPRLDPVQKLQAQLRLQQAQIELRQQEIELLVKGGAAYESFNRNMDSLGSIHSSNLEILQAYHAPIQYIAEEHSKMLQDSIKRAGVEEQILRNMKSQGLSQEMIAEQSAKVASSQADIAKQQDYIRRSWMEQMHEMSMNAPSGGSYSMPMSFSSPFGMSPTSGLSFFGAGANLSNYWNPLHPGTPGGAAAGMRMGPYQQFYQNLLGTPDFGGGTQLGRTLGESQRAGGRAGIGSALAGAMNFRPLSVARSMEDQVYEGMKKSLQGVRFTMRIENLTEAVMQAIRTEWGNSYSGK